MTADEARLEAARRWMRKSAECLEVAQHDAELGPASAINRAYYAVFYAACAVLILDGRKFVKHTGVRNAIDQFLVLPGRISEEVSLMYKDLMDSRHEADYDDSAMWTSEDAHLAIQKALTVLSAFRALLPDEMQQRDGQ